jgi:glycosyltransferase involved in cell wall biosynthesis
MERRTLEYASHVNVISEGFLDHLEPYPRLSTSVFTHGIDAFFLDAKAPAESQRDVRVVVYAGNIGRGQSLDLILPPTAKALEGRFRFVVVGDGSTRPRLEAALGQANVTNVEVRDPVPRRQLVDVYAAADYLLIHQNDAPSRERDTPSKVFELAAFDKPILAGVGGFSARFIRHNVSNSFVFAPGDVEGLVRYLSTTPYTLERRDTFIRRFRRDEINRRMAASILNVLGAER